MEKAQFKVKKLVNFGSSEPWVARTWMSFHDFIDKMGIKSKDKERIDFAFDDMFESLSLSFISLKKIYDLNRDPNTPSLDLKKEYFDFYDKLWTAYKDRFQNAIKELGFDIGFLFKKDSEFYKEINTFFEKYNDLPIELKNIIIEDRNIWQNKLSVFRNKYLQHKSLNDKNVENFLTLNQVDIYFYNVWTTIEDITINLIRLKLPDIFCFKEIEESKREIKCPVRFEITINPIYNIK
jgi:hypothetical protein